MVLKEGCSYLSMSVYLGNKIISISISYQCQYIANYIQRFFSKQNSSLHPGFFVMLGVSDGMSSVGHCEGNHSEGCNIILNTLGKQECVCGMGCKRWE